MSLLARPAVALDALVDRVEKWAALDPLADALVPLYRRIVPDGPVRDVASGVPGGHPLHPALVAVPIGSLTGAVVLDLLEPEARTTTNRALIGIGLASAVPAAYAGWSDWLDTMGAERRVGLVHALANAGGLSLFLVSWRARGRGKSAVGSALAGAGLLGLGGWLGGHLAYALGVGVDTTAFQRFPDEWTDVAASGDVPADAPVKARYGDVPVLLVRTSDGLHALADRCTHRGAPLDEGSLENGCITCPWHGSVFDLRDGSVVQGPATRPQPVLEVRENDGRVEVRRTGEQRTLRTNPA